MSGSGWGMAAAGFRQFKKALPRPHFLKERTRYGKGRPRRTAIAKLVPRTSRLARFRAGQARGGLAWGIVFVAVVALLLLVTGALF